MFAVIHLRIVFLPQVAIALGLGRVELRKVSVLFDIASASTTVPNQVALTLCSSPDALNVDG